MEKFLVNKVANSNLVTVNLEKFFPSNSLAPFDIKDFLFHGLILKEKDFRLALKEFDWAKLKSAHLCVYCSTDAIIPTWAYMLVASYAEGECESVFQGNEQEFLNHYYNQFINSMDASIYQDERIVIKGCSDKPVPAGAYLALTSFLKPVARSIMYGEPCSTVPIYKKPRQKK